MRRITSALFLDFDNIFSGLLALDRGAALALAETPGRLISQLAIQALAADEHRDLLVRRAYLNPTGSVQDPLPGNDSRRIPLNRFRPHLVRAGFEVIDVLAEYAATETFALNEATRWSRDTLGNRGTAIGRGVFAFIIRGCLFASVRLDAEPPPSAATLRTAFAESVTERARSAGLEPTDADLALLDRWFAGQG